MNRHEIAATFKQIQDEICLALENADGKAKFQEDLWKREEGGGGRTRVLQEGNVIEKGGVNFSAVEGKLPENIAKALNLPVAHFFATGVSIVQHPVSPEVPIIHMNIRYFEIAEDAGFENKIDSWFGGGIDLTPHYVEEDQAKYFHQALKNVCDGYKSDAYDRFKKWADDYFYNKHRKETRGIGGVFYDRIKESPEETFAFTCALGRAFAPIYCHLIDLNKDKPYSEKEKNWQLIRRGRYVEFNLVYDKGTKFGLDTDGRIESILMSLPLHASWPYNPQFEKGSREHQTLKKLVKGVDWV